MPDGDVVYYGVSPAGASAYNALCQDLSSEYQAGMLAKFIRKTLKQYGNPPLSLAAHTAADVANAISAGGTLNAAQESCLIDESARELHGHRRGMELSVDACKACIMIGVEIDRASFLMGDMLREYMVRVLYADFVERLPLLNHHNDISPDMIDQRLERLRPHLNREIERMVAQLVKKPDIRSLRKERSASPKPAPDFDTMDISLPESAFYAAASKN